MIMWDASTWKAKRTLAALEPIESTGFVCNGRAIYSGGENGSIRLWATASGGELTREQPAGTETDGIVHVLHYPSLSYLISVHADQVLKYHSLEPVKMSTLEAKMDPLPVTRRVSGTHDEVIDLAYVGSDKSLLALNTNSEDVRIVSLEASDAGSGEGKYFGADVASLKGHEDIIICLDVDWSGHWLATGAKDNTARLRSEERRVGKECPV